MTNPIEHLNLDIPELDENEYIDKGIVIFTTIDMDGRSGVYWRSSNNMRLHEKLGLLEAVKHILLKDME